MNLLVDWRTGERGKLGQVEIIDRQGENILHTPPDRLLAFAWQPHHQQPLGPDSARLDRPDRFCQQVQVSVLTMLRQELLIATFDAEADHPATGRFHQAQ